MAGPGSFRLFGGLGSGNDINWVMAHRAASKIYTESFFGFYTRNIAGNLGKTLGPLTVTARGKLSGQPGILTRVYFENEPDGTWTAPAGINEITVEAIGPGGWTVGTGSTGGGAGGSYAKLNRISVAQGQTFKYSAPVGGTEAPATFAKPDGTLLLKAAGGKNAQGQTGGVLSSPADSLGDLVFIGGQGGNGQGGAGGGGGSAGPNGNGGRGSTGWSSGSSSGAGGGANGGGNATGISSSNGGTGGTARDGTPGGVTYNPQVTAANGAGGGGYSNATGIAGRPYMQASIDPIWDADHGPSGGQGGSPANSSYGAPGYGGGAGGGAIDFQSRAGRSIVVITYYAPAALPADPTGQLNYTFTALSGTATAKLLIQGQTTRSFAPLTATSSAKLPIVGGVSRLLAPLSVSSTGKLQVRGSLNRTFAPLTAVATGGSLSGGRLTATFSPMTVSATGVSPKRASLNLTFSPLVAASTAQLLDTGSLTMTLGPMTVTSTGVLPIVAQVNVTFAPVTTTARGLLWIRAKLGATFMPLGLTARGSSATVTYFPPSKRTITAVAVSRNLIAPYQSRVVRAPE